MAKDMGAKASTSNQGNTPKSKNKPSKKKRDAAKKRQNIQHDIEQQAEQQKEGEVCNKFIMVDEQLGMDITPLQTQYMKPPSTVPPDDRSENFQMNKGRIIDEYVVDISEDEPDEDNQSLKDPDEDDETSELLIRAFSPHPDKNLADEIQQVVSSQGLSPRGLHHERFKFQVQDINTLIQDPSENNRTMLHEFSAKYIRFLKIEVSILKQKTQLQWFKEGDCNTKYFHSLIRGRRRRLFIHKLIREDGEWIQEDDVIAEAACDHFQKLFTRDNKFINEGALDCIPRMINQEQNDKAAGIITEHSSLTQLIIQWWSAKYNNEAHKLLLQATPIFICWNL
ncbi:hypothetical protein H5410_027575 [Solanum commersonii]|uniref:Uncharacterized protein n=1 Tax=Solanum commersonii TaxID=4109 RepID=A0A9J5YZJ7_SOLCO|nr:hypothetical protein H5410_027575 [Solanum commersonii]